MYVSIQQYGYLGLGVSGSDPSLYKPSQDVRDFPHTWMLYTDGDLHHGRSVTSDVCQWWLVSKGDTVSVEWNPPHVSVYHNNTRIHQWDVDISRTVWAVVGMHRGLSMWMERRGKYLPNDHWHCTVYK